MSTIAAEALWTDLARWRRQRTLDVVGIVLLVATSGWLLMVAAVDGGDPWPAIEVLLGSAGAFVLGRWAAARDPSTVPAVVVGVGVVAWVALATGALGAQSPLGLGGYPNARAAIGVQFAVAAAMLAVVSRRPWRQAVGVAAAIAFAAVPVLNGSWAGVLTLALVPLAILLSGSARSTRWVVVGSAVVVGVVLAGTVALGLSYPRIDPGGTVGAIEEETLSQRRLALWHDALVIIGNDPVTGVGPGRFQLASPTAVSDADARWAHQEFLQLGAEAGAVGLALLVLTFGWGFAELGLVADAGQPTALAAVALAALGAHASVDYVLHFAPVPLVAALLVGTAVGLRRRQ